MPTEFHWGPTNPHPLSTMHTELVWEGKACSAFCILDSRPPSNPFILHFAFP
jgi:hypothetical protein